MAQSFLDISNVEILAPLGRGATSQVYMAYDRIQQRKIAIKLVPWSAIEQDPRLLPRLEREASILQQLSHPNIVRLFQTHKTSQGLALELEYVDGYTLTQWMSLNKSNLVEPKLYILAKVAQALAVAHYNEFIHRDLKPDNILISKTGEVKLVDFGLAKSQNQLLSQTTQPGVLVGSLAYMAPEAMNEGVSSYASDIFSFGVVSFELLTGQHPFLNNNSNHIMAINQPASFASLVKTLKIPQVDPGLEFWLLSCLQPNAQDRPQSLWNIFSEIMSRLSASPLASDCAKLVAQLPTAEINDEATNTIWLQAYNLKQNSLMQAIEATAQANSHELAAKKQLMYLINQFALLFPNHQKTNEYLSLMQSRPVLKLSHRLWGLLAAVIIVLGAIIMLQSKPSPVLTKTGPENTITKPAVPASVAITADNSQSKIFHSEQPQELSGILKINIANDAKVFVDGIRRSTSELKNLKLRAGSHQLLLEREGFLPIERNISIKAGQTTRINAGEQSGE